MLVRSGISGRTSINSMIMRYIPFLLFFIGIVVGCSKPEENKISFERRLEIFKSPAQYPNYVMVTAHRGDWRNAPENSLLAMKYCIDAKIDIMETDLKMTKDSVLILMHDETLDRTTTGSGYVKDWTLDSLKQLNLINGYREPTPFKIPTLEQALEYAKNKIIIDLDKSYPYIRQAYGIAKKTGTLNQVIFRVNDDWKTFNEKYGDFIEEINYMPLVWWNTKNPKKFIQDYLDTSIKRPVAIEVIFKKEDSSHFLAYKNFENLDCRVMMNTVFPRICAGHDDYASLDDPDGNWGWVVDQGATIIGTDRPRTLLDYLEQSGYRNINPKGGD